MTPCQSPPPNRRGIRLLQGRLLRGASVQHRTTVFVQRVDPGSLRGLRVPAAGQNFARRFVERFGALESLVPGGCLPHATRAALHDMPGLYLLDTLLEAILAVERFAANTLRRLDPPRFSQIVHGSDRVDLVWESQAAWISRASAVTAFAGLIELLPASLRAESDTVPDFATSIAKLRKRARRRQWSPATAVIAHAAKQRGVPHELLAGNYLRVGEGMTQQMVSEALLDVSPGPEVHAVAPEREPLTMLAGEQRHDLLVVDGAMVSALRYPASCIERDDSADIKQLPVPVTNRVHESVSDAAILAALRHNRALVSVEFMTDDITRSCRHGRGRVTAIKPPRLLLHASLNDGKTLRVVDAVLDLIFPDGLPAAIPTALIVGNRRTRSIARSLDRLLRTSRDGVGLTTRDRTTIQGRPIDPTSLGRRHGPAFLLGDPRVAVVVSTLSPRRIVTRGLEVERSSVTAILDPVPGSDTVAYRDAVRVSVAAATDAVVVSAGNPDLDRILELVESPRVLLVTRRRRHPEVLRHAADGGSVVYLDAGRRSQTIQLRRGNETIISVPIASSDSGQTTLTGRRLETALYTVALASALGVPAEHLASVGRVVAIRDSSRAARRSSPAGRSRPRLRSAVVSPDTRHALRLAGNSP